LQNKQRQQNKDGKDQSHVQTSNAASQSHTETNQQHRSFFWIADVGTEAHQRSGGKNAEGARSTVTDNHHHRCSYDSQQDLGLGYVGITSGNRNPSAPAKGQQHRQKSGQQKAKQNAGSNYSPLRFFDNSGARMINTKDFSQNRTVIVFACSGCGSG